MSNLDAVIRYKAAHPERVKAAKKNRRDRIRKLIDYQKQRPCADCGGVFPVECMDFDHISDKKIGIANMRNHSLQTVKREMAKCEVVCANCHRTRTKNRRAECSH